ncbi:hypothetical protein [Cyclobacterium amurskyense]|uniref:hypothetical protein n=1 Tax=Cyclobacterium amurskyense TaxID=320787 RepID=UPI0030D9760A|tara:strand:- start:785 stop:1330 length:546 start_codon:yes stop_codon:yes gene_type:complete
MIRTIVAFIFIFISGLTYGQSNLAIKKEIPTVNFELPKGIEWDLVMDVPPEPGNKGVLMFKHKPIELSCADCKVEPIIAVLYESISDSIDAVEYSVNYIGTKPYQLVHKLIGGFPDYSGDQHSVVFDVTYVREEVEHSVLLAYIVCNDIGIEIICDTITEAFPKVEQQMRDFIRNFSADEY